MTFRSCKVSVSFVHKELLELKLPMELFAGALCVSGSFSKSQVAVAAGI